jgi:hydroxymethylbilane synthase
MDYIRSLPLRTQRSTHSSLIFLKNMDIAIATFGTWHSLNSFCHSVTPLMTSSADAHLNDERVTIRIGSRPSILARHQADLVRNRLATLFPSFNFELSSKLIYTAGDRDKINPLRSLNRDTNIGGVSLWTTELEVALLEGEYDILVHSLKDVPTRVMDGCEIAPVLERADPRDCLVMKRGIQYRTLEEMPPGAVIGTGSVRRVAQLKRRYPSLVFQDVVRPFLC